MHNSVRKLTDGAMIAAIMGAMLLINRQTAGLFEGTLLFILPLPMVFFSAKYGMKQSWIVFFAIMLLCVILGWPQTLFYVAAESLIGMVYGGGIYKKKDTGKVLVVTMLLGAVTEVLTMIVFAKFFGYDLADEINVYKEMVTGMSSSMNMDFTTMVNLDHYLLEIMVIAAVLTGVMEAFVTHMLSMLMLRRLRFHIEPGRPVRELYMPAWTGYLAIAGVVLYYYMNVNPASNEVLQMSLQGLGMASYFFLTIFGIIGLCVCITMKHPGTKKLTIFLFCFLAFMMNMLACIFGFLYITTDMHRQWMEESKTI